MGDLMNGHWGTGLAGLALATVGARAPGTKLVTRELISGTKEFAEFASAHGNLMKHVEHLTSPNPGALTFGFPQWATEFKTYLEIAFHSVQTGDLKVMQSVLQASLRMLAEDKGKAVYAIKQELNNRIQAIRGSGERVFAAAEAAAKKAAVTAAKSNR